MARLFDTTVADYTMGSPTFGKPLGNVLVGGGTRARSDDQVRRAGRIAVDERWPT
jgi:hypothetical protein